MQALKVAADSVHKTLAVDTSENTAIPVDSSGRVPRWCLLTATADLYFILASDDDGSGSPGTPRTRSADSSLTITKGCLLTAAQPLVVETKGWTHIMTREATGTMTLVVTPLEG